MATTSSLQGIPLPTADDPDNVPYNLAQAVDAIEKRVVMVFASATARDSAIPSPTEGMVAWLQDTDSLTVRTGSAWVAVMSKGASAITTCTSTTRPATPAAGTLIFETDTGRIYTWNAASAAWVLVRATAYKSDPPLNYTPRIWIAGVEQTPMGNTTVVYRRTDGQVIGNGGFRWNNNGSGSGNAMVSLPVLPTQILDQQGANDVRQIVGTWHALDYNGGGIAGGQIVWANSQTTSGVPRALLYTGSGGVWAPASGGLYQYEVHLALSYYSNV